MGLYDAFGDLSTERQIGMAVGPIPRSKIKEYGRDELDLSGEALDRFMMTISRIDGEYLSMSSAPHPMEQAAAKQDGKQKLAGTRPRPLPLSDKRKGR